MISLIPNNLNNKILFSQTQPKPVQLLSATRISQDERLKREADESMKEGYFDKAINLYKQALSINPENVEANLNLAKTYRLNSDFENAVPYFEKAAAIQNDDLEIMTLLGECYKQTGNYTKAVSQFKRVLNADPAYDYAKRNLLDTQNLMLAVFNPAQAYKERQQTATKNLNTAINMAAEFLPKGFMKSLSDLTVAFDKTSQMGGRSNIAQYEHNKRRTTIMDDFTYADPALVAAYLTHEFIHAYDNDPYTSIREEQDAYRKQADFWIKHAVNVKDPEMDYVAELYKQSPETLDKRVAEIYYLRDPNIAETSYNHPPSYTKAAASQKLGINSQPIKAYDIIV